LTGSNYAVKLNHKLYTEKSLLLSMKYDNMTKE